MFKRMKVSVLVLTLASMGLTSLPSLAHAADSGVSASSKTDLIDIKSSEKNNQQQLHFDFAGTKPVVKSFKLANPNRLVLDFPKVNNRLAQKSTLNYQGLSIQSMDIAGDDSRLRLVLSLHEDVKISDHWEGSHYILTLTRSPSATAPKPLSTTDKEPTTPPVSKDPLTSSSSTPVRTPALSLNPSTASASAPTPSPVTLSAEILNVDFKKGKSPGSGRLSIDLNQAGTPIDIQQLKNGLTIDFMGTNVPANLLKKFDVSDQMTPISSMEFKQMPDRTRLFLRAQGKWEQSAYQVDNRFFFELKPVFNDTVSAASTNGVTFKGDKLTLNFQNVEVRTILQVLSDFSGLNIITSDTVGGTLTLRLKDVPWDQALELIMQAKNLDKRQNGNVIWIAPQTEIRLKEKEEAQFKAEQTSTQPLITESFEINYAKAADVKALLGDKQQAILSSRGSVVVDARTNMIFIQDIAEKIQSAREMIKKIDIPVRQVMIEARIVEATDSFGKSLGARLGFNQITPRALGNSNRVVIGGGLGNTANTSGQGNGASFSDTYFVNMPAQGNGGNTPGLLSFVLFNNAATRFLNLELSALVSDGRGQILSNPRVVTADKKEASIEQGTQIPYQAASASGATAVSFKNATLALRVTPQITPNGDVLLDLNVNKDSVGTTTSAGPAIDTKSIKTQVLVEDGGTVVIGGIYTQDDEVRESRVPLFGDLPYVGNLFKNRTTSRERREMLVFITPKIVTDKNINDDLEAATAKDELIKPMFMNKEFSKSNKPAEFFPLLPKDKKAVKQSDLE